MTVLLLTWWTGCRSEVADPPPTAAATPTASLSEGPGDAPATVGTARPVELVLERGRVDDGWVSVPAPDDVLVEPTAVGQPPDDTGTRRWRSLLPPGPGVARVERAGCGPVEVPYVVGAVPLLVLAYPTCGEPDAPAIPGRATRLDRREVAWALVDVLHGLELFPEVPAPLPGQEDGPARYVTLAEARAICAWRGGRLPTREEWVAAREGATGTAIGAATRDRLGSAATGEAARALAGLAPQVARGGHVDLDGNVEEWLADGTVAGGSYVSLPDEMGMVREVPANARSETIGFRCAWE